MNNNNLYEDNESQLRPVETELRQTETDLRLVDSETDTNLRLTETELRRRDTAFLLTLFIIATVSIVLNCVQYQYRNTYFTDCETECHNLMIENNCIDSDALQGDEWNGIRSYNFSAAISSGIE